MKKTVHDKGLRYIFLFGLAMIVATVVMAADAASEEEWEVAETVGSSDLITVSVSATAVTVAFEQQGQPPSALRTDLLVGGGSPYSVFTGNLKEMGYSGIRLRIVGTGEQPAETSVLIRRILDQDPLVYRDWRYSGVTVSTKTGEWTIADIPLQRSAGWTTAGEYKLTTAQLDDLWAADQEDVAVMYVRLQAGGFAAQSYSVSDFRLMGEGIISEPANLSPLQHYFGIDSLEGLSEKELATLMALDSDGNGMSDYHEILAGFDPHNAASVFATRVAVGQGRNTIAWDGVLGKTYAVWRSNNLQAGFVMLQEGIRCGATGVMTAYDEDPAPAKPNFYKVVTY